MAHYGSDHDVIQTALDWLEQGHQLLLVTVLKTWGSSPRPPGSLMLMRKDGVHAGSVSGGCVEEDLLRRYREDELSDGLPTRIDYGINRQEATRFGLPCGGRLELLIEKLYDKASLQQLLDAMQHQTLTARKVNLRSGVVTLTPAKPDHEFSYAPDAVSKVFGPRWQMLLIGAGHLSCYVAQLAQMLDYRVIVCDPREEYAKGWSVDGTELVTMMPDDAVLEYAGHERSIVIALTHDPKLDDMALLDALDSRAFYVGAIGSQRNCETRRDRLKQLGLSAQQLQRLHAPVGLDIGSHTPPEIAVSILAQITALRNSVQASTHTTVTAACRR
jgi:xanthine dehydrogenase accessory factor